MNKNFVSFVDSLIEKNRYGGGNDLNSTINQKDRIYKTFFLRPVTIYDIKTSINSLNINLLDPIYLK